ncbi:MAG: hypothetical protein Tsb0032_19470 [Kiloniellaceae bacterium]
MSHPVFQILAVIVVGGIAGGVGSAFLKDFLQQTASEPNQPRSCADWATLWKSVALGLVAALVIPIFLEIASVGGSESVISAILSSGDDSAKRWKGLILLLSFCTIAGVAAQRFLVKMEARILDELERKADAAIRRGNEASANAHRALVKAADAETMAEAAAEPAFIETGISSESDELLEALFDLPARAPTSSALAKKLQISEVELAERIDESRDAGLIRETTGERTGGVHWILRGWGRRRVLRLKPLTENDEKVLRSISDLRAERELQRPTPKDIADHLNLTLPEVNAALVRLLKYGFVAPSTKEPDGWRIRSWGKDELKKRANSAQLR